MPIPTVPLERGLLLSRRSAADVIRVAIYDGTIQSGELLVGQELRDWLGVSAAEVHDALGELEHVGLVELTSRRHARVSQPRAEDRTAVLQTVGALIGGVVRVTVPTLEDGPRAELVAFVGHALATVDAEDADGHGRSVWGLVDRFLKYCENPFLVSATKDVIGALVYRLSVTRTADTTDWEDLRTGYPHLREAIASGDAVRAELATEHIFRLQTPLR